MVNKKTATTTKKIQLKLTPEILELIKEKLKVRAWR